MKTSVAHMLRVISCRYFLTVLLFVIVIILISIINVSYHGITETSFALSDWFQENWNLEQDDPKLLRYIAKYHLEPPSSLPYRLSDNQLREPSPLGPVIQAIFKGQRNGFFVEAGAYNGIQESNTFVLERDFGWTGILIEGNSFLVPELRLTSRKAWIADVCLAMTPYPEKVKFIHAPGILSAGMIQYSAVGMDPTHDNMKKYNEERKDQFISAGYVECFPAFSILAALNVTTVDYFSLDVEGAELKVLQSIPFDRVNIKVFSCEHWIVDGGIPALDAFFKSKNYIRIGKKGSDVFYTQVSLLANYKVDPAILE